MTEETRAEGATDTSPPPSPPLNTLSILQHSNGIASAAPISAGSSSTSLSLLNPANLFHASSSKGGNSPSVDALHDLLAGNNTRKDSVGTGSGHALDPPRKSSMPASEKALHNDAKYKKYIAQIDKCLVAFDNVNEWADFISFIGRLLKTIQSFPNFPQIPRKLTVSKRLSQCLNPALPSGVHQRALEVYGLILKVIGTDGLRADIRIWSAGLFPFLGRAGMNLKPNLLQLYQTYFIPLGSETLRPIAKSFILALLPGLEEPSVPYYEKVVHLLDLLAEATGEGYFFGVLWLIMISTPGERNNVLNYLSKRIGKFEDKVSSSSAFADGVGAEGDRGLLIRAMAAGLEDENTLVRRGVLDLLVGTFKLESEWVSKASQVDQLLLMRAATSIVMHRDLSLTRRLYSWLLGLSTTLPKPSLDLLCSSLQTEMETPSNEEEFTRPYRILISLLDKWEIGAPVVDVIGYEVLTLLKRDLQGKAGVDGDLGLTGNTLYEALDPYLVWRQLFWAVSKDINNTEGNTIDSVELVKFVLNTFKQDDEVRQIHLPLFLGGLVNMIEDGCSNSDNLSRREHVMSIALDLASTVLQAIPTSVFEPDDVPEESKNSSPSSNLISRAKSFYEPSHGLSPPTDFPSFSSLHILQSSFETVSRICVDGGGNSLTSAAMNLLGELVSVAEGFTVTSVTRVDWDENQWLQSMLKYLQSATTFSAVEHIVSTVIAISRATHITPHFNLDTRTSMTIILDTLLRYLSRDKVPYHLIAVNLIWELQSLTRSRHVESIFAERLRSPSASVRSTSADAFGVLWRMTDDAHLPAEVLHIPIFIVLDALNDPNVASRRSAETWMRCNLKSYLRLIDSIIYVLLDPAITRSPITQTYHDRTIEQLQYDRVFDYTVVKYMLDSLLGIMKFGGVTVVRVVKNTTIKRSPFAGLVDRIGSFKTASSDPSYLDVILLILSQFLQSNPGSKTKRSLLEYNVLLHTSAIEVLQLIISRGEIDITSLKSVEAVLVTTLFASVHKESLENQNKLLHILHTVINALTSLNNRKKYQTSHRDQSTENLSQKDGESTFDIHPLFVQTLMDGITTQSNRPVLQHWIDFLLMTVPQFHGPLQPLLFPLNDCVCNQLRMAVDELSSSYSTSVSEVDSFSTTTDGDIIMLLNALERIVTLSLSKKSGSADDELKNLEKAPQESSSGLMGYVSNVFASDTPAGVADDENAPPKSAGLSCLGDAVRVLHALWSTASSEEQLAPLSYEAFVYLHGRVKTRTQKVLEHFFRLQPRQVVEVVAECWSTGTRSNGAFEILDFLSPSAQSAVALMCSSITSRPPSTYDKVSRRMSWTAIPDVMFYFLEAYLSRLEGPIALQVWGTCFGLAKDVLANAQIPTYRNLVFPTLRCITILSEKVATTSALEDRRMRKELQDTFTKLMDTCSSIANRSFEQGNGKDRVDETPLAATPTDEKALLTPLPDHSKGPSSYSTIATFFAAKVLPNLRSFLIDTDKITSVCTTIVYQVVSPAFKTKSRSFDIDPLALEVLFQMTKVPSSVKAWRGQLAEAFNDARFFNGPPSSGQRWKPLVLAVMDSEKERFTELIGRAASAPSANIFTNREYEMLLRSLNLRRLSFVIYSGDKNHFLTQLPAIQEKLVEILKTSLVTPMVHSEVYLCLRVLVCRISPRDMSNLWPIILTELLRVFEQVLEALPEDGSDFLQLVLSACKFLDLLLVLQTEDFQIHQWMFVTDTADAIYHPDGWKPESIADRLAEMINEKSHVKRQMTTKTGTTPLNGGTVQSPVLGFGAGDGISRRPHLSHIRHIESITELESFFSQASITSYENLYSNAAINWDAVENGLLVELFEGMERE